MGCEDLCIGAAEVEPQMLSAEMPGLCSCQHGSPAICWIAPGSKAHEQGEHIWFPVADGLGWESSRRLGSGRGYSMHLKSMSSFGRRVDRISQLLHGLPWKAGGKVKGDLGWDFAGARQKAKRQQELSCKP